MTPRQEPLVRSHQLFQLNGGTAVNGELLHRVTNIGCDWGAGGVKRFSGNTVSPVMVPGSHSPV